MLDRKSLLPFVALFFSAVVSAQTDFATIRGVVARSERRDDSGRKNRYNQSEHRPFSRDGNQAGRRI